MHQLHRQFLIRGLIALDASALAASLFLAPLVSLRERSRAALWDWFAQASLSRVALLGLLLVVSLLIFERCGLYRSRRLASRWETYGQIVRAVSISAVLLGVTGGAPDVRSLATFWGAGVATVAALRTGVYRLLDALRRRGYNLRYVVIVGNGPRGRRFAESLESRPELGYRILGFLDVAGEANGAGPLLGGIEDLGRLLRSEPVDEVAVMLPIKTFYSEVVRIVALCEQQGVLVRLPADLFNARLAQVESEQLEDVQVLTLFTVRGSMPAFLIKRVADVALSALFLVATSPLWALIAVVIRLDSPGSVLFRQVRVGQNGRRFRIWKFRTMITGAEEQQPELEHLNEVRGAAFKIGRDPRATPVGRWLRRTSLDELPQLINVLKGDMSLVGPRPLPLRDAERLSEDWQRRRFSVRPGLTCLWQAGGRHRVAFDEWMRLDLDYIDNWSLLLDLKILLRTLPAVWTGAGAS